MDDDSASESPIDVLRELWDRAGGQGLEAVAARHAAPSRATLYNIFNGKTTPTKATVHATIDAFLDIGARKLPAEFRNRGYWWRRYEHALKSAPQPADTTISDYLDEVRKQYGRLQLDALIPDNDQEELPPVHLRDVFVGQDVRANPPSTELPRDMWQRLVSSGHLKFADLPPELDRDFLARLRQSYQERPRRSVLTVLAHPGTMQTVLLGDPGAGKSTLARYLALVLADAVTPPPELEPLRGLVPLVIELRTYASNTWAGGDFLDLVDHLHGADGLGLPRQVTESLLRQGRALVMFDGLDEVFEPDQRATASKRIRAFAAKYAQTKVIVTSRIVGYQRSVLDTAGFTHYKLEDLSTKQIRRFAQQWYDNAFPELPIESARLQRRLMAAVAESKAVAELAGNPLLVTILAIIGRRRELPRDRREVYKNAVTVLVQHWDPGKELLREQFLRDQPKLVEDDKYELLRRVARRMQAAPAGLAGNHIAAADLIEEFEQFLRHELELPAHQARPGAQDMLEQFRHRNFILSRFGPGLYGFVHRAFLEYFAAWDVVHRFRQHELPKADVIALFSARWNDPAWHEVLRHIAGMLPTDITRQLIEHLLTLNPDWRWQRRVLPHHIVLALQCLSEVHRVGPLTETSRAVVRALNDALLLASMRLRDLDASLIQLLDSTLPSVLATFSSYWVGREVYRTWFLEHHQALALQAGDHDSAVLALATRIAVLLAGEDETLHRVLLDQAESGPTSALRVAAIRSLPSFGEDESSQISQVLRSLVANEVNSEVRSEALLSLKPWLGPSDENWVRGLVVEGARFDLLSNAIGIVTEKWGESKESLAWLKGLLHTKFAASLAAEALATHWSPDFDVLKELQGIIVGHPSGRNGIIEAIGSGWAHVEGVRQWLIELSDSDSEQVRSAAVRTVGKAWRGDPEVTRWLCGLMERKSERFLRHTALTALAETELTPEIEPKLRGWARHDPDSEVRERALSALTKQVSGPALHKWLHEALGSELNGGVRTLIVRLLSESGAPGGWARELAFSDPDPGVRLASILAVAHSGEFGLQDWLLEKLRTEPSSSVRARIVRLIMEAISDEEEALGWLRSHHGHVLDDCAIIDGQSIRWLHESWFVQTLHSKSMPGNARRVRQTAFGHLASLWTEDSKQLFQMIVETDSDPEIRADAFNELEFLGRHGNKAAPRWLHSRLIEDFSPGVHNGALEAIVRQAGSSPAARAWVMKVMDCGALDEHFEIFVHFIRSETFDGDFKRAYMLKLATVIESEEVRENAVLALSDYLKTDAFAWLKERFDCEPSSRVRRMIVDVINDQGRGEEATSWLRIKADADESEIVRAASLIQGDVEVSSLQLACATFSDLDAQEILMDEIAQRWQLEGGVQDWFIATAETAPSPSVRALAIRVYAVNWRAKPGLTAWLWQRVDGDVDSRVRRAAIDMISMYWSHLPENVDRLRSLDNYDLIVQLSVLENSRYWRITPALVQWARDLAENHANPALRAAALKATVAMWQGDPEFLDWLVQRGTEDTDWEPRSQAIWAAMLNAGHLSRVLPWVKSLALQDEDSLVRSSALEAWAAGWFMRAEERAQLTTVGNEDPRPDVRVAAIRALSGFRSGDPEVSDWLRELTQDGDAWIASVARRELSGRITIPDFSDVKEE